MRPLRILHVAAFTGEAWAYGGIPRIVEACTRALAARGHQVVLYATDACSAERRLEGLGHRVEGGVEQRIYPNLSNRLAHGLQLYLPLGLRADLAQHAGAFDVAHLHGCHHLPGAWASHALSRAGVPYVLSPHGTAPLLERRRAAKWAFRALFERGLFSSAGRVLAVSRAERRQLESVGVATDSIEVAYNPVETPSTAAGRGAPPRLAEHWREGARLLYLGTLSPRKRVDLLLEALGALRHDAEARLWIAGDDLGEAPRLRALVRRLGLEPQVRFAGVLEGAERWEALRAADVLVHPAQHEVFGLSALEALRCETPVVVSDDSGCGEVVSQLGGGATFAAGDARALASTLNEVLTRLPSFREAARGAAARIAEQLGIDAYAARLEQVYQALLERPRQEAGAPRPRAGRSGGEPLRTVPR